MSIVSEALKLLGFSTPFIYGSATYSVFHYLDGKASGQAKKAISGCGLLSNDSNTGLIPLIVRVGHAWSLVIITLGVFANVLCDYIALFIIRPFLIFGKRRPMLASLLAPVMGISIVLGVYYGLQQGINYAILTLFESVEIELLTNVLSIKPLYEKLQLVLILAAFVVHLWLPLFALSGMFLRLLYARARAATVFEKLIWRDGVGWRKTKIRL